LAPLDAFLGSEYTKNVFAEGLCPRPRWEHAANPLAGFKGAGLQQSKREKKTDKGKEWRE